jgi:hypothetical protein
LRAIVGFASFFILMNSAVAQQTTQSNTVAVGPWTIATTFKADKFENCTMTRTTPDDLGVVFSRNRDGLLVTLNSAAWRLDRGKAYSVRLSAGSRTVEAKALAESKSVTITLGDSVLNERLRSANNLEVRGDGMTLIVPLDGSAAGLERLDVCFEKNLRDSPEANPFVAPTRKP